MKLAQPKIDAQLKELNVSPHLIHQVVVTEAANARQAHAHTKTRGEVRGGGKKPWRQKGTGRARHSSMRSPVWVGGGITFGPRPNRNFTKDMPVQMRRRAFQAIFAQKLTDGLVHIITDWGTIEPKTKVMVKKLNAVTDIQYPALIICKTFSQDIVMGLQNLAYIYLAESASVSSSDLLRAKSILIEEEAFAELTERAFGRVLDVANSDEKPIKEAKSAKDSK